MTALRAAVALSLLLAVPCAAAQDKPNRAERAVDRPVKFVEKTAKRSTKFVEKTAKRSAKFVEKTATRTGKAVEGAAQKTDNWIRRQVE